MVYISSTTATSYLSPHTTNLQEKHSKLKTLSSFPPTQSGMELFGTRNLSRAFAATTKPAIGENPEGNDGENSELSLELSLLSNDMTTDEITSSFSEPILFHFFTPLENDVMITTESQSELMDAEVSLELKVG
jgi:hypothetical protein